MKPSKQNNPHPPPPSRLEVYDKMYIFIPLEISEDVVKSVTRKLLGGLIPGVADSEALQGWILKFEVYRKYFALELKLLSGRLGRGHIQERSNG